MTRTANDNGLPPGRVEIYTFVFEGERLLDFVRVHQGGRTIPRDFRPVQVMTDHGPQVRLDEIVRDGRESESNDVVVDVEGF